LKIQVVDYFREENTTKATIAEIVFYLPEVDLHIRGSLVQNKSGGQFITSHSKMHEDDETGEIIYTPHWYVSKERREEFQQNCKKAIEEFLGTYSQGKMCC